MPRKGKRKTKVKEVKGPEDASTSDIGSQPESSVFIPDLPKQPDPAATSITPTMIAKQIKDSDLSTQEFSKQMVPVYPSTSSISVEEAMRKVGFEMKHEPVVDWPFAKRPGIGTKGYKISLLANHFVIDIPEGNVYHYDVVVFNLQTSKKTNERKKYRCLNTKESRKVLESAVQDAMKKKTHLFHQVRPAYDGKKNLYTRNPLNIDAVKEIPTTIDNKEYVIEIKPVAKEGQSLPAVSLEPLHQLLRGKACSITEEMRSGIMALETILRHGPALKYVPVYRSFYYPPREGELPPIGGGREIWLGYHQSLHISQWKVPMLNIDTSATTFYESCPVIQRMMNILYPDISEDRIDNKLRSIRALQGQQIASLLKELKSLQIEVTHLLYPRKYRIHGITSTSACDTYFEEEVKGKKVKRSVSDYFGIKYQKLKYPNLPCIKGTKEKNTYLPLEVCMIVSGQHCDKEPTDDERRQIIRNTCFQPELKFKKIKERVEISKKDLELGSAGSPSFAKEFGIRINTTPTKLPGRVLDPPYLKYNLPQPILPVDGVWSMQNKNFFQCCEPVKKWILVSFSRFCNGRDLTRIASSLIEGGSVVGIHFAQPIIVQSFGPNTLPGPTIQRAMESYSDIKLAVVIVPPKRDSKSIYREVKMFCETRLGLMTQCIVDVNAKKCNRNIVSNICQKINAKMGGKNTSLAPPTKPKIFQKPVIIIGADCTHPSPGDTVEPSIAAVVGSLDSGPTKYRSSLRIQMPEQPSGNGKRTEPKAKEIIVELKDMVKEILLEFFEYTKQKKPERIIFYRDGVSEGEFKDVLKKEVKQVREACQEINRDYKPPITFIVVGKRHHTRFMPEFKGDARGGKGNVPPGTTVDTVVTHPLYSDYFQCSHLGIQGTSRPAHYTVLCDDNNFTADELQELSYYLCYTYARCTRSISIPCPVMYAHLAAYRAKQYLYHFTKDRSRSDGTPLGEDDLRKMKDASRVVDKIKNEMYYA